MQRNGYKLEIKPGRHFSTSQGSFVELQDGQNYTVTLGNSTSSWCSVDLYIDGECIGRFQLYANSEWEIERSWFVAKKFKFVVKKPATGSSLSALGTQSSQQDSTGWVDCTFIPETPEGQRQREEKERKKLLSQPKDKPKDLPPSTSLSASSTLSHLKSRSSFSTFIDINPPKQEKKIELPKRDFGSEPAPILKFKELPKKYSLEKEPEKQMGGDLLDQIRATTQTRRSSTLQKASTEKATEKKDKQVGGDLLEQIRTAAQTRKSSILQKASTGSDFSVLSTKLAKPASSFPAKELAKETSHKKSQSFSYQKELPK